MINKPQFRDSLLFGLLGALFFIPFLGGVHLFDWDEINFAECSREMILLGDYLRVHINYAPFWEKTPFLLLASGIIYEFIWDWRICRPAS